MTTTERVLLDPTGERTPAGRVRAQRPASIEGLTVGLLDIRKPRANVYLDRLEELLTARGSTYSNAPANFLRASR